MRELVHPSPNGATITATLIHRIECRDYSEATLQLLYRRSGQGSAAGLVRQASVERSERLSTYRALRDNRVTSG